MWGIFAVDKTRQRRHTMQWLAQKCYYAPIVHTLARVQLQSPIQRFVIDCKKPASY